MTALVEWGRVAATIAGDLAVNTDVGAATRVPLRTDGLSVLRYTVPNNYLLDCEGLYLTTSNGASYAARAGFASAGVIKLREDGNDRFEAQLRGCTLPGELNGADESVAPWHNAFQRFDLGDGIVFTSGQTITITVTPESAASGLRFTATMIGTLAGASDIRKGELTTSATTANQAIITYTPANNYTLLGFNISVEIFSHLCGAWTVFANHALVYETGLQSHDDSNPAYGPHDDDTIQMGVLHVPLACTFHAGDVIQVLANPVCAASSIFFGAHLVGNLTSTGGASTTNIFSICE